LETPADGIQGVGGEVRRLADQLAHVVLSQSAKKVVRDGSPPIALYDRPEGSHGPIRCLTTATFRFRLFGSSATVRVFSGFSPRPPLISDRGGGGEGSSALFPLSVAW